MRSECRHCREATDPSLPEARSVRGWGVLCPDCAARVEVVTNDHGGFVRAYVPGDRVGGPQR
ncbi:hypothetical protein D3D02_17120 [Halobellus sp. Atlit-38R]|uniref:hypothetical protein n=1 Tax=Halobellus sp. Atlit-38R TaxID=2282131 RepID=UPI000EF19E48|nr:hypothetical protein [Halobellus sp. Atlit-38R]RLM83724.1 hypothetical protein D3D02_17120 [Halobellus sp. Atlit-38R]